MYVFLIEVSGLNMDLELNEHQLNTIKAIAQDENIRYYTLEIKPATLKGDGYSGQLLNITLKSETKNLELVLKEAEPTENKPLKVFRRKSYLREMYVYNNVLSEFDTFQRENNIHNGFMGFAKIYGSNDRENSEYLILENLRDKGYRMWNRKTPMDAEHVASVFSEYGKLHAISLAMKEKKLDRYRELIKHLGDFYSSSLPRNDAALTIKYKLQIGFEAVKDNNSAAESFERFAAVAEKFLLEDTEILEDQLVVTHSDCWCNNILFKYEDTQGFQKPKKVCLVDWQLSKMGSPILDLAYFFFACTDDAIFQDYNRYLRIYHNAVSELLSKFSCDAEKLFPYTLLEYHWKKYAKFGLYTALMTINLTLLDSNEGPQPGKAKVSDTETFKGIDINKRNQRIIDIVNFMAENDLI